MLKKLEEVGRAIFNGTMEGDRNRDWKYTIGRREIVIDYVIESMETKERIERMGIEDCIDSDQQSMVM